MYIFLIIVYDYESWFTSIYYNAQSIILCFSMLFFETYFLSSKFLLKGTFKP